MSTFCLECQHLPSSPPGRRKLLEDKARGEFQKVLCVFFNQSAFSVSHISSLLSVEFLLAKIYSPVLVLELLPSTCFPFLPNQLLVIHMSTKLLLSLLP